MKPVLLLLCLLSSGSLFAQGHKYKGKDLEKIAGEIKEEGLLLYRLEAASWHGTDKFMAEFPGEQSKIGGYFSYIDGKQTKCVFVSKADKPKVIGTISFGETPAAGYGELDLNVREMTATETAHLEMRQNTADLMQTDTIFKFYENTGINIVPVLANGRKDVYVMTSTTRSNVVLMGNDYLVTFLNNGSVEKITPLHRSLISLSPDEDTKNMMGMMHTHLPEYSPFMTPTDICIAKLYAPITGWENYSTVSAEYISIWTGKALVILPNSGFKDSEKILKDHEKRKN